VRLYLGTRPEWHPGAATARHAWLRHAGHLRPGRRASTCGTDQGAGNL
jgi:hypothetical protein